VALLQNLALAWACAVFANVPPKALA